MLYQHHNQRIESCEDGVDLSNALRKRKDENSKFRRSEEPLRKRQKNGGLTSSTTEIQCREIPKHEIKEMIPTVLTCLERGNFSAIREVTTRIRIMVTTQHSQPFQDVVEAGLVPYFIQLLDDLNIPRDIKLESAWILTNISSGTSEQTRCGGRCWRHC